MSLRGILLVAAPLLAACSGEDASPSPSRGSQSSIDANESSPAEEGAIWFEDMAASSGLEFVYVSGHTEGYYMPQIMGGGAALFDMDGDGDLDAYLVQGGSLLDPGGVEGPGNCLFANQGARSFEDVSQGSGADDRGYGNGVAVGDFDNDGRSDLYVTNVGTNALLRNLGDGKFEDVSAARGVGDSSWGSSTTFLDADRDGALDLFVTNYLNWSPETELPCRNAQSHPDYCSPTSYESPARDVFYRNSGSGRFEDLSEESGVAALPGTALGVVAADFDDDGWPDVFVANDGMPDRLWRNGGQGTFENVASMAGCAVDENGTKKAGMGVAVSDVDHDGDLDLIVCNLNRESDSLYLNRGGVFTDRTSRSGLGTASKPFTRFGLGWLDFDNDGYVDMYQANGRVQQQSQLYDGADPYAEPNLLFRGGPHAKFEEVSPRGGTREPKALTSRAAAFGDVDSDGGVDILVVNRDGSAQLLINAVQGRGHWVLLDVLEVSGRPALGARVDLTIATSGDAIERRADVRSGYSYQAANDSRVHVGLGLDAQRITRVVVTWADGKREAFGELGLDRNHTLRRGQSQTETR